MDEQINMPSIDRSLEDFIFGFDINYKNITDILIERINRCCVDDVKDIIKNTPSVFKILKTDLTKNDLYKLRCKDNKICLIWPHDKHPICSSKGQKHIEDEDINILKFFDIFVRTDVDEYKEKEKLVKERPHFKEKLREIIERYLKKEYEKEEKWMSKAYKLSLKSKEINRWVGAILIKEKKVLSEEGGYNTYLLRNEEQGGLSSKDRTNEVVHAEMDALLNAKQSLEKSILYTTTFPCENCAKHIIHSGIKKVIYIEPYRKSRAEAFYTSFITLKDTENGGGQPDTKIPFLFFEGIGPRLVSYWQKQDR